MKQTNHFHLWRFENDGEHFHCENEMENQSKASHLKSSCSLRAGKLQVIQKSWNELAFNSIWLFLSSVIIITVKKPLLFALFENEIVLM